jgi:hypothetical protein
MTYRSNAPMSLGYVDGHGQRRSRPGEPSLISMVAVVMTGNPSLIFFGRLAT